MKILITEKQFKNIVNFISEQSQPIKAPTKISYKDLENIAPSLNSVKTNTEILNQLESKNIVTDLNKSNFNVNDKNFLSKVSKEVADKGFTPYLNVVGNEKTQDQLINLSVKYSIPDLGIDLTFKPGYFGVTKNLPFLNDAKLTGKITATAPRPNTQRKNIGARFNLNLTIPISK